MSHGIETTDKFGEVRENGQVAWHGLGVEIPSGMKTVPAFETLGIDWKTELLPVFATYKGDDGKQKQFKLPTHMAHVRSDTKELLSVVGAGYKPISNVELAEFADTLVEADHGVTVETAGTLLSGKVVFALVRLPQDIQVTDQDILQQYVLLRNSHDCSTAFRVYPTSVRVVCANTLRLSETDAHRGIACWHTGNVKEKIEHARMMLGMIGETTSRFAAQVRLLAAKHVSKDQIREYFLSVYDGVFGVIPEAVMNDEKSAARFERKCEKRDEIIDHWVEKMDEEHQTIGGIGDTPWAAYNAVSEWHDHERGRFQDVKQSRGRVHSNLFGVSDASKQIAFKRAMSLIA
jgi:phage/plasmid-like protein (TIGR03299 family)